MTRRSMLGNVKVLLFGATGMVGQGVLRECLLDPDVRSVIAIGRSATAQQHSKLREILHANLQDYSGIEAELTGLDACYFCLGVSSAGMSEQDYRRITYDVTLAAATVLARLNPNMVFIYVSGMGTDSSERGRVMWARVKGQTENAVMRLPFRAAYAFRPAVIVPLHGIRSKTAVYRIFYSALKPLLPLLVGMRKFVTTTEKVGLAMLRVTREVPQSRILENIDINNVAEAR